MHGIIQTFLLAMTPVGELRVAIPVAITVYKLNWLLVYVVAVIGNLVPVVFLLLFLDPVSNWLSKRSKFFDKFFNWLFKRTCRRVGERVKKYGPWALMLFVAIPLPITGAWTGSLIAYLFKMPFKKAFGAITAGVVIAGVIVTLATRAGIILEHLLGLPIFLVVVLLLTILYLIFTMFRCPTPKHTAKVKYVK